MSAVVVTAAPRQMLVGLQEVSGSKIPFGEDDLVLASSPSDTKRLSLSQVPVVRFKAKPKAFAGGGPCFNFTLLIPPLWNRGSFGFFGCFGFISLCQITRFDHGAVALEHFGGSLVPLAVVLSQEAIDSHALLLVAEGWFKTDVCIKNLRVSAGCPSVFYRVLVLGLDDGVPGCTVHLISNYVVFTLHVGEVRRTIANQHPDIVILEESPELRAGRTVQAIAKSGELVPGNNHDLLWNIVSQLSIRR